MRRKIVIIISSILIFAILVALVELGTKLQKKEDNIKIVTTIFPAYDFARAITQNEDEIEMLIKPGVEIHSYDPSPMDIVKIQKADMFIYIGGENEEWAEKILESIDLSNKKIIKLMDYTEVLEEEIIDGMQAEEESMDNEENEYDEHIWTNPKNSIKLVKVIEENLEELYSENKESYRENANKYIERIEKIDKCIEEIVANAKRNELVFGDRFPFRYLTEEYGLKYYAAFPGCSAETEASSGTITYLIDKIRDEKIPTVLYIEMSTRKVADIISGETGAKTMCLHSCQNVTKKEFISGKTYADIMEENIEVLKEALN